MKKWVYVANWKMNMPLERACSFYRDHAQGIEQMAERSDVELILCPSFVALSPLKELLQKNSHVQLGAQNCTECSSGSYTGDVDALSLKQVGCSYCIIGHSERRRWRDETDEQVALKVSQLHQVGVTPIVCVGGMEEGRTMDYARTVLKNQLAEMLLHITPNAKLVIAYEPVSAIGTGVVPAVSVLTELFDWLRAHVYRHAPTLDVRYLYGGSVQPDTIAALKTIQSLDGFLIGGASLTWESLKKVIG
jgi:triosephosphate isomerase (TIM)